MLTFIKDIMSAEVNTVSCDSSIEQTETSMLDTNRQCVPVVDNSGECVGVLCHGDLLRARNAKRDIATTSVRDIMSSDVISVSPHCSVEDAMDLMIDHGTHHVVVIMNNKVTGMVSVMDIIQVDKARILNPLAGAECYVPAS